MYSNKDNVNMLTALLVKHGIRHAVVCPGSRNAPLVHNLNECPHIRCVAVTDERSAGFYAIGMAQAVGGGVAVCVTSGTALLNLAPAVAEAYHQHVPLVVVSADRPEAWIDQQDGQTLWQPDALGRFVKKAVTLPEPKDETERWHCNRLLNEALLSLHRHGAGPVHVNVPITEPLFDFSVPELPEERHIVFLQHKGTNLGHFEEFANGFLSAKRPMMVIGQTKQGEVRAEDLRVLRRHAVVLAEPLAGIAGVAPSADDGVCHFDEVLYKVEMDENYLPDHLIYIGGNVVSKRLKHFLRTTKDRQQWIVNEGGEFYDTFMHLSGVIEAAAGEVVSELARMYRTLAAMGGGDGSGCRADASSSYIALWERVLQQTARHALAFEPPYSQMAAVKCFEEGLRNLDCPCEVHYANSTSVRLANIYANHFVWCNRGVNGIEGSLSVAAGMSVASEGMVFCVIGDLSFFYDQNALWNRYLSGNFRILLLNNGCGGIFHQLKGLSASDARDEYIAAGHHTEARGICEQNRVEYMVARNEAEMKEGIHWLLTVQGNAPMLLEVFTRPDEDDKVFKDYYRQLKRM